ncbi:MAG: flagellar hook capping FlgD N-terminal domain-containing protein [Gemmatimonadota bacterium]
MTAPIGNTTSTDTTTPSSVIGKSAVMGKDDFLKLLVTQLKNQDPMNPLQGTEYATQLAQFSSVEQLIQIGKQLDSQAASQAAAQSLAAATASTSLGAAIIGHDVLVAGSDFTATKGSPSEVMAEFASPAAKATVHVLDAKGNEVYRQEFADLGKGRQTLTLDTDALPTGAYTFKVEATTADNVAVKTGTYTRGTVSGMAFTDGDLQLRVNGVLIPMKNILEVLPIAPISVATNSSSEQTTP